MTSLLVVGTVSGLVAVRQALVSELTETANAIMALDQSYSFSGQSNCESSTAGSSFSDGVDSIMVGSTAATPGGKDNKACD